MEFTRLLSKWWSKIQVSPISPKTRTGELVLDTFSLSSSATVVTALCFPRNAHVLHCSALSYNHLKPLAYKLSFRRRDSQWAWLSQQSDSATIRYDWILHDTKFPSGQNAERQNEGLWNMTHLRPFRVTWVNMRGQFYIILPWLQVGTSPSSDEKWSYPRIELLYRWYIYI